MAEVTVNIQLVLKAVHDGPEEGLEGAKYDTLLEGMQVNNPTLGRDISEALNMSIRLVDNTVGWIDDNVSFGFEDILALDVLEIVEVTGDKK